MDAVTSTSFGTLLRQYRQAARLTQEALAERAGLGMRTIRLLEQDGSTPQRATAQRLASALGLAGEEGDLFLMAATPVPRQHMSSTELPLLPHALPLQPTPFIGRQREVDAVQGLLLRDEVRLVTLTGPGGIGKTRLALQTGTALRATITDGLAFVPLAPLDDPALVISAIAQGLDVREGGERPLWEGVEAYLRDKHLLLLLDNFEHLLPAVPLIASLLATCPRLKVLVTSRAVLHLQGEHEFAVPPLALPDLQGNPELDSLAQVEAITLFLQRVQAVKPDFQLDPANAGTITEICLRLEGLPLALELAAARIKVLSPVALLQRLNRRLQLLTGGAQDLPQRQQTLRDAIAWSYELLTSSEQRLFERLAVFAGGCVLEAAEAVCNAADDQDLDVLDVLQSLVDKSLVRQVDQLGGDVRFMMLETLREYALEQLEAHGGTEATRYAHGAYYLQLAQDAEPKLRSADQLVWLERLEAEHDNLRAALRGFIDRRESEAALRLTGALVRFWFMRGYLSEGRGWLDETLQIDAGGERNGIWVKALSGAGVLAYYQGAYGRATTLCSESLQLSRQLDDQPGVVAALHGLALVARAGDNFVASCAMYEESVAILRDLHDPWGLAHTLNYLGLNVLSYDKVGARALIAEGLGLFRETGDRWGIGMSLNGLGLVAAMEGKFAEGRPLGEEALVIYRNVGDQRGMTRALNVLACIAGSEGDYTAARKLYIEALTILCALGERVLTPICLDGLAVVSMVQGQPAGAVRLFAVASALREARGIPTSAAARLHREQYLTRTHSLLGDGLFAVAWSEGQTQHLTRTRALLGDELFAAAWTEGQTMTPEQAISEVDREGPQPSNTVPAAVAIPIHKMVQLTGREVEVLALAAQGLTDAQVAARLVVSPRTVNFHLSSIYSKLGVNSRTAAARYARDHNLIESPSSR